MTSTPQLRDYVQHKPDCRRNGQTIAGVHFPKQDGDRCTCGLHELLAGATPEASLRADLSGALMDAGDIPVTEDLVVGVRLVITQRDTARTKAASLRAHIEQVDRFTTNADDDMLQADPTGNFVRLSDVLALIDATETTP